MINAISKNKIAHLVEPNSKRTLCKLNLRKGSWSFCTKTEDPKCEHCQKENNK